MKTSNLVALIVALLITTGGFEGINLLFTHASNAHEQESAALAARI
jgi:flagellar basal body-associated protein FliL